MIIDSAVPPNERRVKGGQVLINGGKEGFGQVGGDVIEIEGLVDAGRVGNCFEYGASHFAFPFGSIN